MVFTSCNGFHSDSERARFPGARAGEMWRRINERHWKAPFHLLIQGGDQIYADAIFRRVKSVKNIYITLISFEWSLTSSLSLSQRVEGMGATKPSEQRR